MGYVCLGVLEHVGPLRFLYRPSASMLAECAYNAIHAMQLIM
jgi:hypothetical protein